MTQRDGGFLTEDAQAERKVAVLEMGLDDAQVGGIRAAIGDDLMAALPADGAFSPPSTRSELPCDGRRQEFRQRNA